MDVLDAIRLRRSIKPEAMKPDPVDVSLIHTVLDAANWAPSHGHTEPWRFQIFTGGAKRRLAEAVCSVLADDPRVPLGPDDPRRQKTTRKMDLAPVVMAIVCASSDGPKIVPHEEIASTAIAVHNMHLAARAYGLGAFWSSGTKAFHPRMATFLGLGPNEQCLGFFYLGWPRVPWPGGTRRPIQDKLQWFDDIPSD